MTWVKALSIILTIPLAFMVVGDFRHRRISVLWLAIFGVAVMALSFVVSGAESVLRNSIVNLGLLLYLSGCLALYFRVRTKRWTNLLKDKIGLGDLLFFVLLIPLFTTKEYLFFIVGASLISLGWWAVVRSRSKQIITIPFVGTSGVVLAGYLLYSAI